MIFDFFPTLPGGHKAEQHMYYVQTYLLENNRYSLSLPKIMWEIGLKSNSHRLS